MWEIVGESIVVWRFVALPAGTGAGYVWHWLCESERGEVIGRSDGGYRFYYDCLEDARRHGYNGVPRASEQSGGLCGQARPPLGEGAHGVNT